MEPIPDIDEFEIDTDELIFKPLLETSEQIVSKLCESKWKKRSIAHIQERLNTLDSAKKKLYNKLVAFGNAIEQSRITKIHFLEKGLLDSEGIEVVRGELALLDDKIGTITRLIVLYHKHLDNYTIPTSLEPIRSISEFQSQLETYAFLSNFNNVEIFLDHLTEPQFQTLCNWTQIQRK